MAWDMRPRVAPRAPATSKGCGDAPQRMRYPRRRRPGCPPPAPAGPRAGFSPRPSRARPPAAGGAPRPGCAGAAARSSSPSSTGTTAWAMIGPVSVPPSTKCTVQPENLTPWSSACLCGCRPGKAGSRAGWMLMTRSGNARRNSGGQDAHEPGQHHQLDAARLQPRGQRLVELGPAGKAAVVEHERGHARPLARARAPRSRARCATTAATRAGPSSPRAPASSSACRLVPLPESEHADLHPRNSTGAPGLRRWRPPGRSGRRSRPPRSSRPLRLVRAVAGHADHHARSRG